jgi:hypothetical protein
VRSWSQRNNTKCKFFEVSEPVMPLYYIFHGKLHPKAKK